MNWQFLPFNATITLSSGPLMTPELPGTYINLLAEIVKRRGISCEQLLEGSGVTPEQLKNRIGMLSLIP